MYKNYARELGNPMLLLLKGRFDRPVSHYSTDLEIEVQPQ